ncbi:MAG TPA: methylmalonyl-CoA epimerase [Bacillota bacterium]|nr:methylmalonyl-CoA epimerase [Bacillota bacterium]
MKTKRVLIVDANTEGGCDKSLEVSNMLREVGMEVIEVKHHQSPLETAQKAIEERVDVIGLFTTSDTYRTFFPQVVAELNKQDEKTIPVIGGGRIPSENIPPLLEKGFNKIFPSGSSTEAITTYIQSLVAPEQNQLSKPEKIAHIGIAVKSIDETLAFYTDILGLDLEAVEKVASEGVKVAFLKIGESRIELLEPLHETSPIQRFIDKRGEGIHHIALEVDQINKRLEHYKQSGVRLINEEAKQGAHNSQIAFIHPKASYGVLYEMCQHMGGADE